MIDWTTVKPGDPDPEGGRDFGMTEVCGQPSTLTRSPLWMCTRIRHEDDIHVACGVRGIVLAAWGPNWQEEVNPGVDD